MPCALPARVQLSQGGCQLSEGRDGFEYEVEDPRRLRWVLAIQACCAAASRRPAPPVASCCICCPAVAALANNRPCFTASCRRLLEQKLTLNSQLRGGFLEGLAEQLAEPAALHAALKPMAVTGVRRCCSWRKNSLFRSAGDADGCESGP